MFCDYQVNLGNTTNLNSSTEGWRYSIYLGRGEKPYVGGLDNHLGTMLYYLILIRLIGYLYLPTNLKDIKDHNWVDMKS